MAVVTSIKATRINPMCDGKNDQWAFGRLDCSIQLANHLNRFEFQIRIETRGNIPREYRSNALTLNFPGVPRGMDGRSTLTVPWSVHVDPFCLHPSCICYWMRFCVSHSVVRPRSTSLQK